MRDFRIVDSHRPSENRGCCWRRSCQQKCVEEIPMFRSPRGAREQEEKTKAERGTDRQELDQERVEEVQRTFCWRKTEQTHDEVEDAGIHGGRIDKS